MKRETIDKFLYHNVTLIDCNGTVMSGYFVPYDKKYKLFPDNGGWDTYVYRPSHIRKLEATSKAKQQPSIRPIPKKKGNKKVGKELLEKASKVRSVGRTMGRYDIYLDEFQEKKGK